MKLEETEFTFSNSLQIYSVTFRNIDNGFVVVGIKNKTTGELLSCKEYETNILPQYHIAKSALERILNK